MSQTAIPSDVMPDVWPPPRGWHVVVKVVVSLLILFHIGSMIVASYCAGDASPLAYDTYLVTGPYAQVMYVNHGYRFFSPDPGDSTLVEFEAVMRDGSLRTEVMPNRGEGGQWPRVFYHRHFMLTEFLTGSSDRPLLFDQVVEAYASHYLSDNPDVAEVTLVRVIHTLASPDFIRAGGDLLHEGSFIREPLGTFRWDDEAQAAVRVDGESFDPVPLPVMPAAPSGEVPLPLAPSPETQP